VVNVWATWCQPCRSELPTLQALHDSTGTVVLVSDEPRDEVRAFLDRAGHDMPAYVAGQWPSVLEGQAVPRTFVVDGNGQVIYRHVGAADWGSAPTYAFLRRLREQGGPS
jgi:thiol-disulfide isomerase/thioredoxin